MFSKELTLSTMLEERMSTVKNIHFKYTAHIRLSFFVPEGISATARLRAG
ncbi:MAG: hypothetical protein AAB630_03430 [Patescibacteria group bacterium]